MVTKYFNIMLLDLYKTKSQPRTVRKYLYSQTPGGKSTFTLLERICSKVVKKKVYLRADTFLRKYETVAITKTNVRITTIITKKAVHTRLLPNCKKVRDDFILDHALRITNTPSPLQPQFNSSFANSYRFFKRARVLPGGNQLMNFPEFKRRTGGVTRYMFYPKDYRYMHRFFFAVYRSSPMKTKFPSFANRGFGRFVPSRIMRRAINHKRMKKKRRLGTWRIGGFVNHKMIMHRLSRQARVEWLRNRTGSRFYPDYFTFPRFKYTAREFNVTSRFRFFSKSKRLRTQRVFSGVSGFRWGSRSLSVVGSYGYFFTQNKRFGFRALQGTKSHWSRPKKGHLTKTLNIRNLRKVMKYVSKRFMRGHREVFGTPLIGHASWRSRGARRYSLSDRHWLTRHKRAKYIGDAVRKHRDTFVRFLFHDWEYHTIVPDWGFTGEWFLSRYGMKHYIHYRWRSFRLFARSWISPRNQQLQLNGAFSQRYMRILSFYIGRRIAVVLKQGASGLHRPIEFSDTLTNQSRSTIFLRLFYLLYHKLTEYLGAIFLNKYTSLAAFAFRQQRVRSRRYFMHDPASFSYSSIFSLSRYVGGSSSYTYEDIRVFSTGGSLSQLRKQFFSWGGSGFQYWPTVNKTDTILFPHDREVPKNSRYYRRRYRFSLGRNYARANKPSFRQPSRVFSDTLLYRSAATRSEDIRSHATYSRVFRRFDTTISDRRAWAEYRFRRINQRHITPYEGGHANLNSRHAAIGNYDYRGLGMSQTFTERGNPPGRKRFDRPFRYMIRAIKASRSRQPRKQYIRGFLASHGRAIRLIKREERYFGFLPRNAHRKHGILSYEDHLRIPVIKDSMFLRIGTTPVFEKVDRRFIVGKYGTNSSGLSVSRYTTNKLLGLVSSHKVSSDLIGVLPQEPVPYLTGSGLVNLIKKNTVISDLVPNMFRGYWGGFQLYPSIQKAGLRADANRRVAYMLRYTLQDGEVLAKILGRIFHTEFTTNPRRYVFREIISRTMSYELAQRANALLAVWSRTGVRRLFQDNHHLCTYAMVDRLITSTPDRMNSLLFYYIYRITQRQYPNVRIANLSFIGGFGIGLPFRFQYNSRPQHLFHYTLVSNRFITITSRIEALISCSLDRETSTVTISFKKTKQLFILLRDLISWDSRKQRTPWGASLTIGRGYYFRRYVLGPNTVTRSRVRLLSPTQKLRLIMLSLRQPRRKLSKARLLKPRLTYHTVALSRKDRKEQVLSGLGYSLKRTIKLPVTDTRSVSYCYASSIPKTCPIGICITNWPTNNTPKLLTSPVFSTLGMFERTFGYPRKYTVGFGSVFINGYARFFSLNLPVLFTFEYIKTPVATRTYSVTFKSNYQTLLYCPTNFINFLNPAITGQEYVSTKHPLVSVPVTVYSYTHRELLASTSDTGLGLSRFSVVGVTPRNYSLHYDSLGYCYERLGTLHSYRKVKYVYNPKPRISRDVKIRIRDSLGTYWKRGVSRFKSDEYQWFESVNVMVANKSTLLHKYACLALDNAVRPTTAPYCGFELIRPHPQQAFAVHDYYKNLSYTKMETPRKLLLLSLAEVLSMPTVAAFFYPRIFVYSQGNHRNFYPRMLAALGSNRSALRVNHLYGKVDSDSLLPEGSAYTGSSPVHISGSFGDPTSGQLFSKNLSEILGGASWGIFGLTSVNSLMLSIRSAAIYNFGALAKTSSHVSRSLLSPVDRFVNFRDLWWTKKHLQLLMYRLPHLRVINRTRTRFRFIMKRSRRFGIGEFGSILMAAMSVGIFWSNTVHSLHSRSTHKRFVGPNAQGNTGKYEFSAGPGHADFNYNKFFWTSLVWPKLATPMHYSWGPTENYYAQIGRGLYFSVRAPEFYTRNMWRRQLRRDWYKAYYRIKKFKRHSFGRRSLKALYRFYFINDIRAYTNYKNWWKVARMGGPFSTYSKHPYGPLRRTFHYVWMLIVWFPLKYIENFTVVWFCGEIRRQLFSPYEQDLARLHEGPVWYGHPLFRARHVRRVRMFTRGWWHASPLAPPADRTRRPDILRALVYNPHEPVNSSGYPSWVFYLLVIYNFYKELWSWVLSKYWEFTKNFIRDRVLRYYFRYIRFREFMYQIPNFLLLVDIAELLVTKHIPHFYRFMCEIRRLSYKRFLKYNKLALERFRIFRRGNYLPGWLFKIEWHLRWIIRNRPAPIRLAGLYGPMLFLFLQKRVLRLLIWRRRYRVNYNLFFGLILHFGLLWRIRNTPFFPHMYVIDRIRLFYSVVPACFDVVAEQLTVLQPLRGSLFSSVLRILYLFQKQLISVNNPYFGIIDSLSPTINVLILFFFSF